MSKQEAFQVIQPTNFCICNNWSAVHPR